MTDKKSGDGEKRSLEVRVAAEKLAVIEEEAARNGMPVEDWVAELLERLADEIPKLPESPKGHQN